MLTQKQTQTLRHSDTQTHPHLNTHPYTHALFFKFSLSLSLSFLFLSHIHTHTFDLRCRVFICFLFLFLSFVKHSCVYKYTCVFIHICIIYANVHRTFTSNQEAASTTSIQVPCAWFLLLCPMCADRTCACVCEFLHVCILYAKWWVININV